jgi:amidohydrolase
VGGWYVAAVKRWTLPLGLQALVLLAMLAPTLPAAANAALRSAIEIRAKQLETQLVTWRRHLHAHPELGNQEIRTSAMVAEHLRALGLEVRTNVARTGVVAVLKGGTKGPVVALRADMDGLPVHEATPVPFASKDKGRYRGAEVDVMHACGHDGHVAILMAVAQILSELKRKLPGTVVFYFQPAEEGPSDFVPNGTNVWGAKMMIEEGVMKTPAPAAVLGLHLWAGVPAGRIAFRSGATMASSDDLHIRVRGTQTHAARPWDGIDPIVLGAQVILGLQTVVSRQTDLRSAPTVVTIGTIHGGTRYNIIPEVVDMEGTIRAYDQTIRRSTHQKVRRAAEGIAASGGGSAEVRIVEKYDPTINDANLAQWAAPTLKWAANGDVVTAPLGAGAEDFSFFAKQVPGLFFFVGVTPRNEDVAKAAPNHSPQFFLDESALSVGVRALAGLAVEFLSDDKRAAAGRDR